MEADETISQIGGGKRERGVSLVDSKFGQGQH